MIVNETVQIDAPTGFVFDHVSNHETYMDWFPGALLVRSADPSIPHGQIGKRYFEDVRSPSGNIRQMEIRVVACEQGSLFRTESELGPFKTQMEVRVASLGEMRTELNWRFASRNRSAPARMVFRLLAGRGLRARAKEGLQKLKLQLEMLQAP